MNGQAAVELFDRHFQIVASHTPIEDEMKDHLEAYENDLNVDCVHHHALAIDVLSRELSKEVDKLQEVYDHYLEIRDDPMVNPDAVRMAVTERYHRSRNILRLRASLRKLEKVA
jgi:hypothetical protein